MSPSEPAPEETRPGAPARRGQPVGALRLRSFFSTHWQWVFLGQVAAIVGSLALVKVAALVSEPEVFGRFALILAVGFGINAILFTPINAWAYRYYQEARETHRLRTYYLALMLSLGVGVIAATLLVLGCLAVLGRQLERMDISSEMMLVALALGVGAACSDAAVSVANAAFFRRSAAVFLTLATWIRVLVLAVAYLAGARSAQGFGLAVALATVALVPIQAWTLRRSEKLPRTDDPRPDRAYLSSLLRYALPFFLWGIPGYIVAFGDRLVLAYYTDSATVGVYAAMAAATTNLISAAGGAANRVIEPTLFASSGAGTDAARVDPALRTVGISTAVIVPIAAPVVLVYLLWPDLVITLFSSADYRSGSRHLWLLLVAATIFVASQQLMYRGYILKRLGPYLPTRLAHAALVAAGLVFAIPRYGLSGLIGTLVVAHSLQFVLVAATNRFRLPGPR